MNGVWLALFLLGPISILLGIGRKLQPALKLEQLGVPIALVAGLIGLLIGPYGPLPLLPQSVEEIWAQLPTPLLTLIFATLMLGTPIPNTQGLIKPVASQALLGLLLGFGQYFVGGIAVIFLLSGYVGIDPLMGCLIEVGFEGGHGAAAIMGESFRQFGFSGGQDLGLAMATVGLLSSTLLGSGLIVIGRTLGWLKSHSNLSTKSPEIEKKSSINLVEKIKVLAINLGLAGGAVGIGFLIQKLLQSISPFTGEIVGQVMNIFPVFPLALGGSLLIRFCLERIGKEEMASEILQREMGVLATDLLITTAIASLNIPLLLKGWYPITVLSFTGLAWNLIVTLLIARFIFKQEWFERSIAEFGNATGVAASGLLLLRLADPLNQTKTLSIFSLKQLLIMPILSGGVITVIAPLVVNSIGLTEWTEICACLTGLLLIFAFIIKGETKSF